MLVQRRMILVLLLAALLAMPGFPATAAKTSPAKTLVSLTFDDGFASVMAAASELRKRDMHGTFYISSGFVGEAGRLTWDDIRALQAEGNEIGGHTVNHPHLDALDDAEQARQICDDRVALSNQGLRVTNFAYPFAASGPTTGTIVKNCGYNSARSENSLGCSLGCPAAESVPPLDAYSIRTSSPVITSTPVSRIIEQIEHAEAQGNGWIPVVFHEVCDGCSDMAITPTDFGKLLDWLESRASKGTEVATVAQVIGGDVKPAQAGPVDSRPAGVLVNPSLEVASDGSATTRERNPSLCWVRSTHGTNKAEWSSVSTGRTGSWAEQVTMTDYTSGDQKLITRQDSGSCAPAVVSGQSYSLAAWYKSSAPTRMVAFYRLSNGAWTFWAQSPQEPPSDDWRELSWQTPPAPPEATRISFGLQLASTGTMVVDDFNMTAAPPAASAPSGGSWQDVLLRGLILSAVALPLLGLILAVAIFAKPRKRPGLLTK